MHTPSAAELLDLWERGIDRAPPERAMAMLAAARPEMTGEALRRLTIGERDGFLLTMRDRLFGRTLACVATCPACGETLELTLDHSDLCAGPAPAPGEMQRVAVDGYDVVFRLPDTDDLIASLESGDLAAARERLLARCVLRAEREEATVAAALPTHVVAAVIARMADADPQADIELTLSCPACTQGWGAVFDIVSFLWSEIETLARRLVSEVQTLASAYGWRECDILALSRWRRQLYLDAIDR